MPAVSFVPVVMTLFAAGLVSASAPLGGDVVRTIDEPEFIATGDLNGDGVPDLVVSGLKGIDIYLGSKDGRPGFSGRLTPGGAGVVIADVTGDGALDIVAGALTGCAVAVHPGVGDGSFEPPISLGTGCGPATVIVADLTGDGVMDIASANVVGQSVSVVLGEGGGAFAPAFSFPTPIASGVGAIAVIDINNDGAVDLITIGNRKITFHMNDGEGAFSGGLSIDAGVSPRSVQAADVTGNGLADVLLADESRSRVLLFQQFLPGEFLPQAVIAVGLRPDRIMLSDLDGDGPPELVVMHSGTLIDIDAGDINAPPEGSFLLPGGEVRVLRNESGRFAPVDTFYAGPWPRGAVAADFDGDGVEDLAIVSRGLLNPQAGFINSVTESGNGSEGPGFLTLVRGLGGARHHAANRVVSTFAGAIRLADIDGDGVIDLLEGREFGVFVRKNSGDGLFGTLIFGLLTEGLRTVGQSFAVGQLDSGSAVDMVAASDQGLKVAFGNGSGFFTLFQVVDSNTIRTVDLVDVTGDGRLDAVAGGSATGPTDRAYVYFGDGAGGFTLSAYTEIPKSPVAVTVADFDGDGTDDAAFACRDGRAVAVVLLDPDLGIRETRVIDLDGPVLSVRSGVLTGNATPSIVTTVAAVVGGTPGAVIIEYVEGEFVETARLGPIPTPMQAEICDLTLDGRAEIIVADADADTLVVYSWSDEAGGYIELQRVLTGDFPRDLRCADVNGDGRPDVVSMGHHPDAGDPGSRTFTMISTHFNAATARMTPGDINGDGVVGPGDLVILLNSWGPCAETPTPCESDLNGDGVVNGSDLLILLSNFGG